MICSRCQQVLSEDAHFCSACGSSTAENDRQKTEVLEPETLRLPADPLVGQVLDSKYQLVSRLGEGGMGIVYCAHRLHIGDDVAVKVLHRNVVRDEKAIERFRREARSAAAIRHPNVVTIHDFNEAKAEGAPAYIVMELVRGKSLRDLLREEQKLSPARAVALMQQICAGVGAAHRQNIVHRDLKPDNVIIVPSDDDRGETVKVLDFGLAKLRDVSLESALTESGAMLGTPSYMPPEQCRGEELDARSDVYSLGAILYEMLTGVRPFHAPSIAAVIAKHLYDSPPAFPADTDIPPALKTVCLRALAKDREARPADANAFSRELQTAITSRVTAATHSFLQLPAASKKASVLPWLLVALLTIAVAAVVGIFGFGYLRGRLAAKQAASSNGTTPRPVLDNPTGSTESASRKSNASNATPNNLVGNWSGTYGVMNSPATLTIKTQNGSDWNGVLEQGAVRVAVTGHIDSSSRKVTIKETQVLSGSGWSLGTNSGELSADGRTMSGTGQDAAGAQLGMSYDWSFSR